MSNPEYYHGAVQLADGSKITTKYGDAVGVELGCATDTKVWERRPIYLVPVPWESDWCKEPASPAMGTACEFAWKQYRLPHGACAWSICHAHMCSAWLQRLACLACHSYDSQWMQSVAH